MCEPGTIAGVGAAVGGGLGFLGSREEAEAAEEAMDVQWEMYQQSRADMAPWREAGERALGELESRVFTGPGDYKETEAYQFRMDQGLEAIRRNAAARGFHGSGPEQKALMEYGQRLASEEYDRHLNRYYASLTPFQSLAGVGQTASTNIASLGSTAAANIANNQLAYGQARASGYTGIADAGLWGANQYARWMGFNQQPGLQGSQSALQAAAGVRNEYQPLVYERPMQNNYR